VTPSTHKTGFTVFEFDVSWFKMGGFYKAYFLPLIVDIQFTANGKRLDTLPL